MKEVIEEGSGMEWRMEIERKGDLMRKLVRQEN